MTKRKRGLSANQKALIGAAVVAALTVLGEQLAQGNVPIPKEAMWLVPILVAVIAAVTPYFKPGGNQE